MISDSGDALDSPHMRCAVVVVAITLLAASVAAAQSAGLAGDHLRQDRVLGLLMLPEVFGNGPCHPFEPSAITLHTAPGGAPLGSIRVDQHWSFAPHGGCEGLQVGVHGAGPRAELPTLEYANESPAAIVLASENSWFKIRLAAGAAWLHASPRDRFMPLADLFSEHPTLTALTVAHRGALFDAPGVMAAPVKAPPPAGTPVRVLDVRPHGDQSWLHVALMSHSVCDVERSGPPEVVGLGWVAAHAPSGEPAVWFSSRGC